MKEPSLWVAQDPTMPAGRCCVITVNDNAIIYSGPIGGLTEELMQRAYALLLLNPVDFADGQAFMKATRH